MFDKAKVPEYAIEYNQGHWVIAVRNQGQKAWTMLRDENKPIHVQNEFGDVIQTRPAVRTFPSPALAQDYATENLKGLASVHRKPDEIEAAGKALIGEAKAYDLRDGINDLKNALSAA
jgi:hypothetical protein